MSLLTYLHVIARGRAVESERLPVAIGLDHEVIQRALPNAILLTRHR